MPPKKSSVKKKSSAEKTEEKVETKAEEKPIEKTEEKIEAKAEEKPIEKTEEKVEEKSAETDLEKEIMADLENLDKDDTPITTPSPKVPEPETREEVKAEKPAEKIPEPEPKVETPEPAEPLPTSKPEAESQADTKEAAPIATIPESPAAVIPTETPVSVPSSPTTPEPSSTAPSSLIPEGKAQTPAPASAEAEPEDAEEIPEEEAPPEAAPVEGADAKKKVVMDKGTMRNVIEAALFVAGRPISVEELNIKTELKKKDIEDFLKELILDYMERNTSIEIVQMQEKYSMQVKPQFTQNVKKFASGGLIPEPVLKTLTIIALKQPMMKNMLIKIRGSGAYDHVKFLIEHGFITNQKKGRSDELITTEQFSDTFGLSKDIATLKKQLIAQLGVKEEAEPAPKEG